VIVVDTNVIAYLWIPGPRNAAASALLSRDDGWVAPPLWRSELRNVLATLLRAGQLTLEKAASVAALAEEQMESSEVGVASRAVLELASSSGCSAYDCEFVALARSLEIRLVTADRRLVKAFPGVAMLLEDAVEAR